MIKLEHLTKFYNRKSRGIIDVSLEIKEGEIFGFIGPNGAGKSTTVRTMLNLIFPTSGSGTIMGLDIVKDTVEIRKNIGYMPAEINFYGDMKAGDFLQYSAKYYDTDYQDRLNYLVNRLKVDLDKKIEDLSFGNKKKLAIIQAFLHEPKILILDEPTSGLDPLMQNVFFELLFEEKKRGATIFFSSHVLSDVQRICDRVGIIREGKLIKIEKINDILKTKAKKIKIISEHIDLTELKGVSDLEVQGLIYNFIFTENVKELLDFLKDKTFDDITISEPTLEEIFMHYYS